jgi:PAS domain S-box-containing protein
MSRRKEKTSLATDLRQRAEIILGEKQVEAKQPATQADTLKLLHELQVHKIELELQNQELRLARQETENVLERYTDLYEFAPVGYLTVDCDGMILQSNLTASALLGIDRSQLLNRRLGQFISAETRPVFNAFLKKICSSDQKESCDVVIWTGKNNRIFVRLEARASIAGQQCRIVIEEITDLKLVDKTLHRVDSYNRILIEASLDPLVTIDAEGMITDVNTATEKITGINRSELIGMDFSTFFTEPERARFVYQQVFLNGPVHDYALAIQHRDGHVTPVLYNADVYKDETEKVIGVFAVARDVTKLKQAEDTLRMANVYDRSLIEASLDPLVTITLNGKIGDVNAATELITGLTRDELIGTDFSDYFTEPAKARAGYRRAFTDGSVRDYELSIRHRDGRVRPVLYNASVYRDEAGNGIGVFAAARDITERKRVENLIQQDAARAETMAEISRSLVEAGTDPRAILDAVARTTATTIGDA